MKKALKFALLLLLVGQLPFIYRVCQSRQLHTYSSQIPRQNGTGHPFQDLRGSLHIHSAAGSHSIGTYLDIIEAAEEASYDYVFITDHPKEYTLFNQIEDPGIVVIYGWEEERPDVARNLRSQNNEVVIFSSYTQGPVPDDATGIEVFNIAENARPANGIMTWMTWLYHQPTYPDQFFFHLWQVDEERLRLWDETTAQRKLAAVAGNNAHQNLGLILQTTSGARLLSVMVDPYVESFRFVTNHTLLPLGQEVSQESVLAALRKGSSYIAFEGIADPTGFAFYAKRGDRLYTMGDEVPPETELIFQAPVPSRFELIRAGETIEALEGSRFVFIAVDPGAYRVEVYPLEPPRLIKGKPWIISNPIYVQGEEEAEVR